MSAKFSRKHLLWLLLLLAAGGGAMMMRSIHPFTNFNGTIASGQVVTGTLATGTQVDTYTFPVNAGQGIQIGVGSDGTVGFEPIATVSDSGGTVACTAQTNASPGFVGNCNRSGAVVTSGGTWKVKITSFGGVAHGGYTLTLATVQGATAISSGQAGGLMYSSSNNTGSITRGSMDFWTTYVLPASTGVKATVTITWLSGTGFQPEFFVFNPNGVGGGGTFAT
jgi:hypothetical protein